MAATGADGLSLPEGPRSGHQAEWDAATIATMVRSGKLKPVFPSSDCVGWDECPICFGTFPAAVLNSVSCCSATLCTSCFLQCQAPDMSKPCPFCTSSGMAPVAGEPVEPDSLRDALGSAQAEAAATEAMGGRCLAPSIPKSTALERQAIMRRVSELQSGRHSGAASTGSQASVQELLVAMGIEDGPQADMLRAALAAAAAQSEGSTGGARAPSGEGEGEDDDAMLARALAMSLASHTAGN
ncbi:hypothetical protein FNF28_05645 [Cafeteria roenbergensis]|nr:hypothetical protein FNF28_05645 [Cafeteria roenbergensis]